jgi:alpha-tubulin suppressor-like RCC1 family protein
VPETPRRRTIAAGWRHTCAIRDGTVLCWGLNDTGQLGDGSVHNRDAPVTVPSLRGVVALATGMQHTCALDAAGEVSCWGSNTVGQIGPPLERRLSPVRVLGGAVAISAGGEHTCASLATGAVACWGHDGFGQLGDGTRASTAAGPVTVRGLVTPRSVEGGRRHTCAIDASGMLVGWGSNDERQLGSDETRVTAPDRLLDVPGPVLAVSAGETHTAVQIGDGRVILFGSTREALAEPHDAFVASDLGGARELAAGPAGETCVIGISGIRCVGIDAASECPWGCGGVRVLPGSERAAQLSLGFGHVCAIDADGRALCWGSDELGQLGDGPGVTDTSDRPARVAM